MNNMKMKTQSLKQLLVYTSQNKATILLGIVLFILTSV
jgi:hypothetical protein